ncbi:Gut esterase [Actinidia rufa]|uniref:Gut esterase n=1 Tax=Actinidia rufa TaxID=165716 RepID=A0A7J0ENL6_9ERIC|nr:Gut esterase [Actinidia rufa]
MLRLILQEASLAVPLFSPVLVPMAQSIGPLLSQIASSPTVRLGAEMTMKQLENLSPPIMKQVLPLVEQLPPLYMDLVNGRENFTPKPEETRRLVLRSRGRARDPNRGQVAWYLGKGFFKVLVISSIERRAPWSVLQRPFEDCAPLSILVAETLQVRSCVNTEALCGLCALFLKDNVEFVNTYLKVVSLTKQLENFKTELKKTQATIDASWLNKAEAKSALSQAEKQKEDEENLRYALTQLALAQVLTDSAISSMLDMSIRSLPGDHGLPLQQALPNVPPAMADAVNRGGEFLANLTAGTPWETAAREMSNTLGVDSRTLRAETSKDIDLLVEVIASWMASNTGIYFKRDKLEGKSDGNYAEKVLLANMAQDKANLILQVI